MAEQILAKLVENPPALANKGNLIRSGVNVELDNLRNIASGGKQYLAIYNKKNRINRYFFT